MAIPHARGCTRHVTTTGPVRRADAVRNRERVLEAATVELGGRGLDAQMEDIARRAGVGVGTVYRHFPTKEALAEAVVLRHLEELCDRARAGLAEGEAGPALEGFLHWSTRRMVENRCVADTPVRSPALAAAQDELLGLVAELLHAAQRSGDVRHDAVPADVPAIVFGVACASYLGGVKGVSTGGWRRHLALALDALRPEGRRPRRLPPPG
jgi:AcrR family transcriptional regulator